MLFYRFINRQTICPGALIIGFCFISFFFVKTSASYCGSWAFDTEEVNLGEVAIGEVVLTSFPATNNGWGVEQIVGQSPASCGLDGCVLAIEGQQLFLEPGKQGIFIVSYTPRFPGFHNKEFEVFTAGQNLKTHVLRIRCHAVPSRVATKDNITAQRAANAP